MPPEVAVVPANVPYVNSVSYRGGAERSLLTLMCYLDGRRYRPFLVTSEEGVFSEGAVDVGVPVAVCDFPEMAEFLQRHPIDVAFYAREPRSVVDGVNASFARSQEDQDRIHTGLGVARAAFTWEQESVKWLQLLDRVERQAAGSRPRGEPAQEDQ